MRVSIPIGWKALMSIIFVLTSNNHVGKMREPLQNGRSFLGYSRATSRKNISIHNTPIDLLPPAVHWVAETSAGI